MTHNVIQLVKASVNGYCDLHGTDPEQCGAARELGQLVIAGATIYGLWKWAETGSVH